MPVKLIAPPHTPFHADGSLNLRVVADQARLFTSRRVAGVFIGGSTGEGPSLTTSERMELTDAWVAAADGTELEIIVHVGHNCQRDAADLARHAAESGVDAVATAAPCYFRPDSVQDLIDFCLPIAKAAESIPFYFYDIPIFTHVQLSMVDFLVQAADAIPNLRGLKYTNPDLVQLQECLATEHPVELLYGLDEQLLPAYVLGVRGAVGSTYNFVPQWFHQLAICIDNGDAERARQWQLQAVRLIRLLAGYGFIPASKFVMSTLGVDCGPARSPLRPLTPSEQHQLTGELRAFDLSENAIPAPTQIDAP